MNVFDPGFKFDVIKDNTDGWETLIRIGVDKAKVEQMKERHFKRLQKTNKKKVNKFEPKL